MLWKVKSYVAEMGLTEDFYQQLVNTEPSQMVIYKEDDFTRLFPQQDPVYAEVNISREARLYGISTTEWRRRDQEARSCDGLARSRRADLTGAYVCRQAIMWGLSDIVKGRINGTASALTPSRSKQLLTLCLSFFGTIIASIFSTTLACVTSCLVRSNRRSHRKRHLYLAT